MRVRLAATLILGLALSFGVGGVLPAWAAGEGCSFAWPLETEIGWFQSAKADPVASGTELPEVPAAAVTLALLPLADAKLAVAPSKVKNGDGPNAGAVTFTNVPAGTYQVTITSEGWIDLVQDGAALKAGEHTGSRSCPDVRKSVRYQISAGKLTVQVSGANGASIKVAVKRAE